MVFKYKWHIHQVHTCGTSKYHTNITKPYGTCLWHIHIHGTYTYGVYTWNIHYSTYICKTFQVFECQITISMLYTCYTLHMLLLYGGIYMLSLPSNMWLIMWLYMFPNVLSYHYLCNCSSWFYVLSLNIPLMYLIIAQLCTTWSGILCVFYGVFIHVFITYVDEVYSNLKIYMYISCKQLNYVQMDIIMFFVHTCYNQIVCSMFMLYLL